MWFPTIIHAKWIYLTAGLLNLKKDTAQWERTQRWPLRWWKAAGLVVLPEHLGANAIILLTLLTGLSRAFAGAPQMLAFGAISCRVVCFLHSGTQPATAPGSSSSATLVDTFGRWKIWQNLPTPVCVNQLTAFIWTIALIRLRLVKFYAYSVSFTGIVILNRYSNILLFP